MKRKALIGTTAFLAVLGFCGAAYAAVPNAAFSVGSGFHFNSSTSRLPTTAEFILSYSLVVLKADLGLQFDLEHPDEMVLRPGARIFTPGLYFRAGFPYQLSGSNDWGILLGVGRNLVNLPMLDIFVESDVIFWRGFDKGVQDWEFRFGVNLEL